MARDNEAPSELTDREAVDMEDRRVRRAFIRAEGERIAAYVANHPEAAAEMESYTARAEDFEDLESLQ